MKIYTPVEFTPEQQQRLLPKLGSHQIVFGGKKDADRPLFEQTRPEIIFGSVPGSWLLENVSVKWIQLDSTGFSHYRQLDWKMLGKRITVTNLPGFFAEPAAETAMAGLLGLLRGIDRLTLLQAQKKWDGLEVRWHLGSLHHATVAIVGFGTIGRRVAALISPYHCKIISFAPNSKDATIHTHAELDQALPECDVVIAAMPETPQTVGIFSAERLAKFKKGAIFVNIGRGSCVDENAMVSMLQSGALGGAVLDVTIKEPLPLDHPLWTTPNTILTQHSGGGTRDEHDRKPPFFLENLARYEAGLPLNAIVNWERGY